jgi:23S rRNA (pseudouridine1915-N3)-methyltransferase
VRLRVVAIGKDRSGLFAPAVDEYAGRLARYVKFELVEVPEARKHAGTPRAQDVALVIGGSDGLSDALRARGQETIALSRMTLPHRLARVLLLEQLYRAMTILRGEPYHK